MTIRAIDCWVNVNMSDLGRPAYLEQVAKNYFKQGEDFFRDYSLEETLELMDHLEIGRAHVHGFSMGGGIVTQLLQRHSDRLITASYCAAPCRYTCPPR